MGMTNYVIGLQKNPCFRDGYYAADRGEPRHCFVLQGQDREAWMLGYDQAIIERTERGPE